VILSIVAVLVVAACIAVPIYMLRHARAPEARELPPLIFSGTRSWQADQLEPVVAELREAPRVYEPTPVDVDSDDAVPAGTETVHFRRPSDQAVQLLPGRLQVLSGLTMPREIRFVRIPGERPQLILGREPGSSPPHVALPSSTVSRQHARLDFSGGRWGLTNLSHTNPVVLNDETLSSADGERALTDGDRIELGDVVLRFSAH
jgi:hypothetical protein